MFVNTLAMRAYPEREKSFKQLLRSEVKDNIITMPLIIKNIH
jgi:hypothetical protein